ncbi:unnamed protein product, partial [Brenthis ino]
MSEAFSQSNILSGFRKTGIHPYNPNIFTDEDFLCSAVTDREITSELQGQEVPSVASPSLTPKDPPHVTMVESPSTSIIQRQSEPSTTASIFMSNMEETARSEASSPSILTEEHSGYAILILEQSKEVVTTSQLLDISTVDSRQKPKIILPEIIRPFPKSAPRKSKRFGRQPGKTKILTKTPEKQDLEQDHCKPKKMKTKVTKNKQKGKTKKRTVKRQVLQSSESETDLEGEPKYVSSDSTWDELPDRSDSWFCFVCGADEKIDMRLCMICGKYVHEMCVGLSKEDKEEFICPLCSN